MHKNEMKLIAIEALCLSHKNLKPLEHASMLNSSFFEFATFETPAPHPAINIYVKVYYSIILFYKLMSMKLNILTEPHKYEMNIYTYT